MCLQSLIKDSGHIMTLRARCHRITEPGGGRLGKRTWEVSTARSMMNNGSLDWFSLFQAFRYTFCWNIVASGSNLRTQRKKN